ncbi:uncharacterized protein LOC142339647 isoform X2 [Convolutriloba macropyga]|uniref:uncharacterized protein LOC142339647 isoform X2 n=1 Tax=Convolutriloba macropyga TaxID=536237 RepID=UPI003F52230B
MRSNSVPYRLSQAAILILLFYVLAALVSLTISLGRFYIFDFSIPAKFNGSHNQQEFYGRKEFHHEVLQRSKNVKIQKILITTVGRSGSSAFGQILGQMSEKSFYVFEPLHRYSVKATSTRGTLQEIFRLLCAYLTCNVPGDLRERVYNHRFARITRRDSRLKPVDPKAPEEVQFKELCPLADLRIIKSIRLTFLPLRDQQVLYKQLLDVFPDLAIVILYRDPRKVYLSSEDRGFGVSGIKETCTDQLSLHLSLGRYSAAVNSTFSHANRIFPVKYESMSADALEFAQTLRKQILGSALDGDAVAWIKKNIITHRSKGSSYELSDEFSKKAKQVKECVHFSKVVNYKL